MWWTPRSAPPRRSRRRSRRSENSGRRRRRPRARALLGAEARHPRRDPVRHARQPGHRPARHQSENRGDGGCEGGGGGAGTPHRPHHRRARGSARRRPRRRPPRRRPARVRPRQSRSAYRVLQGVRQGSDATRQRADRRERHVRRARPRPPLHPPARRAARRPGVRREVVAPTLRRLAARGARYTGVLYAGLMLADDGTPYVLEFNCRFGDPETQALLPALPGLTRHLVEIATGSWRPERTALDATRATVATVLAAAGYPDKPELGAAIIVPRDVEPGTLVFHAGTYRDPEGTLRVHGGRVLAVTGLGDTVAEAARRSAAACELIVFQGKTYRRDIGWREIRRSGAGAARG